MNRSSLRTFLLAAAVGVGVLPLGAQLDVSKPIPIKVSKPKVVTFKGEVLHANPAQITVRSRGNERVIRTFTLSPKMSERMQRIVDRGGCQYGDKVEIRHEAGSDVALNIQGKPSKPF